MSEDLSQRHSAFRFHGTWQEFAGIAFPNLLLTIVTLGIYRFWATTREREYLWGKTDFIDERLEWTGRGIELFIGFIMVFFLIGLPLIVIQLISQGLIFRGETIIAGVVTLVMFVLLFYLGGVAYFRALRYRLSRTYWRGIRGGSDDPGFQYGLSYMWKSFVGLASNFPDGAMVDDFAVERTLERDELWPAPLCRDRRLETADEALSALLSCAVPHFRWRGRFWDSCCSVGQQPGCA